LHHLPNIQAVFLISTKRIWLFLCFTALCCSAQLSQPDLAQRIERQLRASYELPDAVNVTVSPLHSSEFANYDGVTVTLDGEGKKKTYEFLVSKDQKTLIRMIKVDLTKDPYAENMKKIDVKGRPVRGNPNAKVVVVNFDDFECPFCSRAHRALFPEMLKEFGDRVAFIYKDFPLADIHPWAIHAAVDANCLAAQSGDAYWDFADYIHSNQSTVNSEKGLSNQFAALDRISMTEGTKFKVNADQLQSCMKAQKEDAVRASMKEGDSLGVDGTPTMFVNGREINGAHSEEEFRAILNTALQQAGVSLPPKPSADAGGTAGNGVSSH
jgi:protein-disulfide isomerase